MTRKKRRDDGKLLSQKNPYVSATSTLLVGSCGAAATTRYSTAQEKIQQSDRIR
jgi:hypothetical protein